MFVVKQTSAAKALPVVLSRCRIIDSIDSSARYFVALLFSQRDVPESLKVLNCLVSFASKWQILPLEKQNRKSLRSDGSDIQRCFTMSTRCLIQPIKPLN